MARLQFVDGTTLNVNETIAQVQEAVTALGAVMTPMIRLTEIGNDQPVLVFAGSIVSAKEQQPHPLRNQ